MGSENTHLYDGGSGIRKMVPVISDPGRYVDQYWRRIYDPSGSIDNLWSWIYDPSGSGIQIPQIKSRDPFLGSEHMSGQDLRNKLCLARVLTSTVDKPTMQNIRTKGIQIILFIIICVTRLRCAKYRMNCCNVGIHCLLYHVPVGP